MTVARPWRLVLGAVAVVGIAVLVVLVILNRGPLAFDRVTETRYEPQAVRLLGEGGDPLVIMVGVTWPKEGYCSGQFSVLATETASEVRIGTVVSRERRGLGGCAGLGTVDGLAWAELRLASALDGRVAIRASDGQVLPEHMR
jgi:hypothetical protein